MQPLPPTADSAPTLACSPGEVQTGATVGHRLPFVGLAEAGPPVLLAPMSGITDRPFRLAVRRWTDPDRPVPVFSEMIATREALRGHHRTLRRGRAAADEAPMAVQIAGCDPATMADGARIAEDLGAQLVDINMGCPAKKVAKGAQAGAALMRDLTQAQAIIRAVVKATKGPVSLKMRLGWDDASRNAQDLAWIAQEEGVRMLTVHGRTREQFYTGQADWRAITEVVNAVSLPVIGNGDILDVPSAQQLLRLSGCAGVMVGRASQGQPWMVAALARRLATMPTVSDVDPAPLSRPSLAERHAAMHTHLDNMLSHYKPESALRISRKHMSWYAGHLSAELPGTKAFRTAYMSIDDPKAAFAALDGLFACAFTDSPDSMKRSVAA